jgi:hypothetical protein
MVNDQEDQTLGDAPIEPKYKSMMMQVAKWVDAKFNGTKRKDRRIGFVLLVFPLNDHGGRCNYISNGSRDDVMVLLREQLARFEGRMHDSNTKQ